MHRVTRADSLRARLRTLVRVREAMLFLLNNLNSELYAEVQELLSGLDSMPRRLLEANTQQLEEANKEMRVGFGITAPDDELIAHRDKALAGAGAYLQGGSSSSFANAYVTKVFLAPL